MLKDVVCDLCGQSCRDEHDFNYHYATLTATWGYGSGKDGETWEAHICEKCVDSLPFVAKIRRREYMLMTGKGMGEWTTGEAKVG